MIGFGSTLSVEQSAPRIARVLRMSAKSTLHVIT